MTPNCLSVRRKPARELDNLSDVCMMPFMNHRTAESPLDGWAGLPSAADAAQGDFA